MHGNSWFKFPYTYYTYECVSRAHASASELVLCVRVRARLCMEVMEVELKYMKYMYVLWNNALGVSIC